MNTQEATIEALQNRINYLEAHLHLALQVLGEIEKDYQDFPQELDWQSKSQVIDVVPTSKVELPTFLSSRTWKHNHLEIANLHESRDRIVANAS
ncbi:MAG: hypothetical protein DCF19_03255 [Pseudanabaena frigida]|uniref:Uncharacterized protein n=1 Tax=Pseudanabaena frigida TaxID=945775 RepID=A0A2W4WIE2_9CYAN|nr:MAG: hypothetical protein DCF19_03255 [Pseudanabaena frigida]